jgi:hypothetical protein
MIVSGFHFVSIPCTIIVTFVDLLHDIMLLISCYAHCFCGEIK